MRNVLITNKNEEAYSRKFDGTLYSFPPGEAVSVPEMAAAYLFGYGKTDADRQKIVVRNGWQKNGMPNDEHGPEAAMKRLKNFVFKRGAEDKPKGKPEKKVAPLQQKAKTPTGVNAISATAMSKNDGRTILPREAVRIPGAPGPLAPPAPNV